MLQFDFPIMVRNEHYWNSGRMPSVFASKPLKQILRRLQFCIEGVNKLFHIPDDAFMMQFVISSQPVPNSYECKILDDGTINVCDIDHFDWVTIEFSRAILNHSGNINTWFLQCFYWVVE